MDIIITVHSFLALVIIMIFRILARVKTKDDDDIETSVIDTRDILVTDN